MLWTDLDEGRRARFAASAAWVLSPGRAASDVEMRALEAVCRTLLGIDPPAPPTAAPSLDLEGPLAAQAAAVLLVLALCDGELASDRLSAARLVAGDIPVFDDLERVARDQVARARICLLRRATRGLYHRSLWELFAGYAWHMVAEDTALLARYRALADLPDGTFGREIFAFYQENLFRFPGEIGGFPPGFTEVHDARHVLTGWDASLAGELGLAAFESGASDRAQPDNIVAALLHAYAGVEIMEPYVPVGHGPVPVETLVREMARGRAADPAIMDPTWDLWAWVDRPVAEVRERFGVMPGGPVPATHGWSGPAGPPGLRIELDNAVLLPETDADLVAVEVKGVLSAADVDAISDLLARRTFGGRRVSLLIELAAGAGLSDLAAARSELQLALRHRETIARVALVGDQAWLGPAAAMDAPFAHWFGSKQQHFSTARRPSAVAFARGPSPVRTQTGTPSVIVAGAGPGGLALALGLTGRGVPVQVLERSGGLHTAGAGITMQTNAMRALDLLGVAGEILDAGAPLSAVEIRDHQGNTLSRSEAAPWTSRFGWPSVCIHRAALSRVLWGALPEGTVRFGARVSDVALDEDSVRVCLSSGEVLRADVVVGADGIHSAVRTALFGPAPLVYTGTTAWRGIAPRETGLEPGLAAEVWGRGLRFGIVPLGPAQTYWFATANTPRGEKDGADNVAEVAARFADFAGPVEDLIRSTPSEVLLRNDLLELPALDLWTRGRATLLGDAAHAMTPNMGQGGCMAVEDAVWLAAELAAGPIPDALARYEARRRPRAHRVAEQSGRIGAVGQWENPLATRVRNTLAHWTPTTLMDRPLEELYGVELPAPHQAGKAER